MIVNNLMCANSCLFKIFVNQVHVIRSVPSELRLHVLFIMIFGIVCQVLSLSAYL